MNDFLNNRKNKLEDFKKNIRKKKTAYEPIDIPDGLFVKCEQCGAAIYEKALEINASICPYCDYHFKMGASKRLTLTIDQGSFQELFSNILSLNPLNMPDYIDKLEKGKKLSGLSEAFLCGTATLVGIKIAIGVLDSNFMMGSMGSAVGEKVTRLIEYATNHQLPLIIFSASGGARMQEGILSLMQMAKTSAALEYFDQKGLLYISVLTNPTTGGVAASFASLGDINIAEKSSLIGFAGARVIKQTIRQELPEGFQTDLFQLEHGQVDMIVHRKDMRKTLYKLLQFHRKQEHI
ncbi:MAG: acetyl-CoA carboxylase carboxyl transferase subunit beta [Tenericutes bacterium HGW-Tenericutes-3]|nr:MAG: acetyl-CoA carboxylase carboxyl transferase subunit beta [Tenericutes bacterium HGW-Tenericutes-3]